MQTELTPDFDLHRLRDIPDPLQGRVRAPVDRTASPAEPSPSRGAVHGRRWAALALSIAWVVGNLAAYGLRSDLASLPPGYIAVQVVAPFGFAIAVLVGALHPGRFGLGADRRLLWTLTLAGPAAFALLAVVGPPFYPAAFREDALDMCLMCFNTTMIWAAAPLGMAALTLRRAFASGAGWRAALVGCGCGLLAGGTINLHCANADPVHVIIGHGIPMLITTVVGAIVMARWARA